MLLKPRAGSKFNYNYTSQNKANHQLGNIFTMQSHILTLFQISCTEYKARDSERPFSAFIFCHSFVVFHSDLLLLFLCFFCRGKQTLKLRVTKGAPLPFSFDILSAVFCYGNSLH